VIEVRRHIERESVTGNPARDPDADRRELLELAGPVAACVRARHDPRAGQAGLPYGSDAERRGDSDHHLFEIADVSVNVETVRPQIQDGIADELPGTVKRDIAAPASLKEFDAVLLERLRCRQHMRSVIARSDSECDHRWVLKQEQLIRDSAALAVFDERFLKIERLGVPDHAESPDL
jgi:hypothetical protein